MDSGAGDDYFNPSKISTQFIKNNDGGNEPQMEIGRRKGLLKRSKGGEDSGRYSKGADRAASQQKY
jgi:hypothetical protein